MRKDPRQPRAQATLDAILSAAAHVLVEQGYDRATTNRIAEVAGVSIGSLYQYFPNKDAVVAALCERHVRETLSLLTQHIESMQTVPLEQALHAYVEAMIDMHRKGRELHRVIAVESMRIQGVEALTGFFERARGLCRDFLALHAPSLRPIDIELAAFILVHAVDGIVDAAVLEPRLLKHPALVDETCALILRYLGVASPVSSAAAGPHSELQRRSVPRRHRTPRASK
jgi:AcrR family transcriptional regulator